MQIRNRSKTVRVRCLTHPNRHNGLEPKDGCLVCMQNYSRARFLKRLTYKENNDDESFGDAHGGVGKCDLCKREKARLVNISLSNLSNKKRMCESCWDVWENADGRASARVWIRRDMEEYGVPLNQFIGED